MNALDLSYLYSVTDGDKELIKELIEIFISQIPEFRKEFRTAFQNKDADALSKIAHKAKSSVAIMGLTELTQALKDLELEAKEKGFSDGLKKYLDQFDHDCAQAEQELLKLI
jgi:HPt (histidine-containing phosphotransfer) domain-containing protein